MKPLTFWDITIGVSAIGFALGWMVGMFLGLWTWVTLVWR
jgi:hypothetical protein